VGAVLLLAAAFLVSGCLSRSDRPFVPQDVRRDLTAERTLSRLEQSINANDARGVCALYARPARRCVPIWRRRVSVFSTPVRFTMRRLIFGCAGDARLVFVERSPAGTRVRTLSLVSVQPRVYTELITFR
jgi:hypothetical protein